MRLIDADTTKINLDELQETSDQRINALKLLMVLCVEHTLSDAPTVDAVPVRHGNWKPSENHPPYYTCSECENCYIDKEWAEDGKWIYCPSCGAKMDEEAE